MTHVPAGSGVESREAFGAGSATSPPLQDAVLGWAAAVEAVVQETYRIAGGGDVDHVRLAKLHAVVESAREGCEKKAALVAAAMDAKQSRG